MSKVTVSPAASFRPNLLLPALLLLAALSFALGQFLISDPDSGSGIGGTGRFGGESGIGGTGGPVKLGMFDTEQEEESAQPLETLPLGEPARRALADSPVDVQTLRLTPVKPAGPQAPQQVEHPPRAALEEPLSGIAIATREEASRELAALKSVELDLDGGRRDFDSKVRSLIEADLDSTAQEVSEAATELTRELILARAPEAVETASDASPVMIDVLGSEQDERRRLAVPARPERPDRPSAPSQRFTPAQRGIPTPPVRPMRI